MVMIAYCRIMFKTRSRIIRIFLFPLFLCLYACAVPQAPVFEKDGKRYGVVRGNFTDRWYDYYERALSYMDGGFYHEALLDLEVATRKRPEEKRWANTYGMHFMDYFPHRETGISHYFLGNYDAAKSELEISFAQVPSAKARFYVDEVRRQIMLWEKMEKSKPHLVLEYPLSTRDDPVTISGVAKDERYVSEIILSGEKVLLEASDRVIAFKKDLALMQGRNQIEVIARNLLGGEEKRTVLIHVDRSGPVIIVEKFLPGVEIQGYLCDESGIGSFAVNGKQQYVPLKNDAFYVFLEPSMTDITLLAVDKLGNETRGSVTSKTMTSRNGFEGLSNKLLLAENISDSTTDSGLRLSNSLNDRPEVILKGWPEEETVFRKNVDIEGQVKAESKIRELTIQVESKSKKYPAINKLPDLHKTGRIISFSQSVSLEPGRNTIIVRARDMSDRETIKKIIVIREIPGALQLGCRYSLMMCPFDSREWEKDLGVFHHIFSRIPVFSRSPRFMETRNRAWFQHILLDDFRSKKRFQVMAQNELKSRLDEYNLKSIAVTPFEQEALENPHALLFGNTCVDRNGIEITARLVDLQTFEEIVTKDVYAKSSDDSALGSMAKELSDKFHNALPLASGKIAEITKEKIYVFFESGKVEEGWPLILYREEAPRHNPVTGMSLGSDTKIIGSATMGKNETISLNASQPEISKGNRVINR